MALGSAFGQMANTMLGYWHPTQIEAINAELQANRLRSATQLAAQQMQNQAQLAAQQMQNQAAQQMQSQRLAQAAEQWQKSFDFAVKQYQQSFQAEQEQKRRQVAESFLNKAMNAETLEQLDALKMAYRGFLPDSAMDSVIRQLRPYIKRKIDITTSQAIAQMMQHGQVSETPLPPVQTGRTIEERYPMYGSEGEPVPPPNARWDASTKTWVATRPETLEPIPLLLPSGKQVWYRPRSWDAEQLRLLREQLETQRRALGVERSELALKDLQQRVSDYLRQVMNPDQLSPAERVKLQQAQIRLLSDLTKAYTDIRTKAGGMFTDDAAVILGMLRQVGQAAGLDMNRVLQEVSMMPEAGQTITTKKGLKVQVLSPPAQLRAGEPGEVPGQTPAPAPTAPPPGLAVTPGVQPQPLPQPQELVTPVLPPEMRWDKAELSVSPDEARIRLAEARFVLEKNEPIYKKALAQFEKKRAELDSALEKGKDPATLRRLQTELQAWRERLIQLQDILARAKAMSRHWELLGSRRESLPVEAAAMALQ